MASKIAMILDVLIDGKWHGTAKLTEMLKLARNEVGAVLDFLEKFELAKIDAEDGRVKVNDDFRRLLECR